MKYLFVPKHLFLYSMGGSLGTLQVWNNESSTVIKVILLLISNNM